MDRWPACCAAIRLLCPAKSLRQGQVGQDGLAGRGAGGPGGPGGPGAAGQPAAAGQGQGGQGGGGRFGGRGKAGIDRQFQLNELVAAQGGLTPLLFAVRQGYTDSVHTLIAAGADINQVSGGDKTSPLLMAIINGHFDLAKELLDKGANPRLAAENGATPVYAVLNCQWAPKALIRSRVRISSSRPAISI